jgi:transposase-like protein
MRIRPTDSIHEMDQVEVDNKEDRRSRRDELTSKLVYLAIHKAPNKWTMRIRKRRESLSTMAVP